MCLRLSCNSRPVLVCTWQLGSTALVGPQLQDAVMKVTRHFNRRVGGVQVVDQAVGQIGLNLQTLSLPGR